MALLKELKGSFVGGQVSPELQNRIDLEKFNTFLKEAKNTQIKPEGGISNRAGTIYVGTAKDSTYRLTINVNVSATIIINGEIYKNVTTKSVDLEVGSEYTYSVGASGYEVESGSGTINKNDVIDIDLEADENNYTFEISNSQGATITINGTEQSSVTEPAGTLIEWEVSKTGYVTQSGSFLLSAETETPMVVTLEEETTEATVTVTATPNDSAITINGVEQNSITGTIGETITISVTKSGYIPYTKTHTITETETIEVQLETTNLNIQNIVNTASYMVDTIYTYNVYKTGTYNIDIVGRAFIGAGRGGTAKLNGITLTSGDILKIKRINGGIKVVENEFAYGMCGVGIWLNDECILVAGGAGGYYNAKGTIICLGGGGYVGGLSSLSGENEDYNGLSYDGSRGDCNVRVLGSGAIAGNTLSEYFAYGGKGYVADRFSSIAELGGGNSDGQYPIAYAKIDYIG